jgi:hypothetical protein
MVRVIFTLLVTLFVTSTYACDDSGRVTFFDVKGGKGFLVNAFYGADSYSSYFYGEKFAKGESSEGPAGRVFFFVDEIGYQQLAVKRSQYDAGKELLSEDANLTAHFNWELSYLKDLSAQNKINLRDVANYGIVQSKDGDGKPRKFYIWAADLGVAKQYFVSTSSSFGVIALTVLGVKKDQEAKVKTVIDNYMHRYRNLKDDECK